jgi:YbbR domain-containing protein
MKKKLKAFIDRFTLEKIKNDKRIVIFAVCLLIATVLWLMNALEKDYTATLNYPVKYVNPPEKLFLSNTPPSGFELTVEARGFTLLRYKLSFSFTPIKIDLSDASRKRTKNGQAIQIPTENLIRQISNQVSNEISISGIFPETISLVFDSINTKNIPVFPQITLDFKPQFSLQGSVTVIPDSIKVSGPSVIIDTIQFLYTQPEFFPGLDKSTKKMVPVLQPPRTELQETKVTLHISVEKFTEKTVTLPVRVAHQPEGSSVKLFPPQVSVSFMVGLSHYENISPSDFSAVVDYRQALEGDTILDVIIESKPRFIHSLKMLPLSVEYLIETE